MLKAFEWLDVWRMFFLATVVFLYACNPVSENPRLANSLSPYLREHADNPVDWYLWGEEALKRAKAENKPLLISIGYASCHWCHRMEQESFMDTGVARLMNENFICIKVDREERPDIDNLYMHACQLLNNGQAGWPLNAFALPDGKPFFAGTYYSKENWTNLLRQVTDMYRNKPAKVQLQASAITFGMIDSDSLFLKPADEPGEKQFIYKRYIESAIVGTDPFNAGLKGMQKFPVPALWEFFLQYYFFSKDSTALRTATQTLDKMSLSGIYDVVGGGFFRYTTDSLWMVPHFEKMLNDNAQLISLYANAYKITRNEWYRQVAEETIGWVVRELASGNAACYSSLGADTKDGEGAYYLLQNEELEKLSGKGLRWNYILKMYTINGEGAKGKLPYLHTTPYEIAKDRQMKTETLVKDLADVKQQMLAARNKKSKPPVDTKIITSWNALMLLAYIDAYTAFGTTSHLQQALSLARFLENGMMNSKGQLVRVYSEGKASGLAFLDDYAYLSKAFIRLYEVSFDIHWLQQAQKLTEYALQEFYDNASGNFFYAPANGETLALRKVEWFNSVMPASNAVMGEVLLRLGMLLQKDDYVEKANRMVRNVTERMSSYATASPAWGLLSGLYLNPYREVAIAGPEANLLNQGLQANFLPDCIFMGGQKENLPLLKGKLPDNGTLIYVCTDRMCKKPVETVKEAMEQLISKN